MHRHDPARKQPLHRLFQPDRGGLRVVGGRLLHSNLDHVGTLFQGAYVIDNASPIQASPDKLRRGFR